MTEVLIATPTADSKVFVSYTTAIVKLFESAEGDVGANFRGPLFISGSVISHARNAYASLVLATPEISHLLFIDSDIGFHPRAVANMLAFDKPITACMYPTRTRDLARLKAAARDVEDPRRVESVANNYVGKEEIIYERDEAGRSCLIPQMGFVRARRIGMGLTLIRRDVLEIMRERLPELLCPPNSTYRRAGVTTPVLQCFETERDKKGAFVSEDFAFCQRWTRDCGGEIWVNIAETLTHSGVTTFAGNYRDRLKYDASKA